jgi:tRNA-dihydrouridine synthase B
MQDVTDLGFWRVMHRYGDPDLYYTEYFRVHRDSHPDKHILRSIDENPSGRPVIAQMIGQDIPHLIRTAEILQRHPVIGIDLNLGCPAPVVCRKNAGGGLLKHPEQIQEILTALRSAVQVNFTVKTRLGFDDPEEFIALLELFSRHPLDAITIHGRTVREMYRSKVHHSYIAQAVQRLPFPVFANGNVLSIRLAEETLERTGASGLMIGRGAIRNPWIFRQLREHYAGQSPFVPRLSDVREYIEVLYRETSPPEIKEEARVSKVKKYMNFIIQGMTPDNIFLQQVRLARAEKEFFLLCDHYLSSDEIFPPEPPTVALVCDRSERLENAV